MRREILAIRQIVSTCTGRQRLGNISIETPKEWSNRGHHFANSRSFSKRFANACHRRCTNPAPREDVCHRDGGGATRSGTRKTSGGIRQGSQSPSVAPVTDSCGKSRRFKRLTVLAICVVSTRATTPLPSHLLSGDGPPSPRLLSRWTTRQFEAKTISRPPSWRCPRRSSPERKTCPGHLTATTKGVQRCIPNLPPRLPVV